MTNHHAVRREENEFQQGFSISIVSSRDERKVRDARVIQWYERGLWKLGANCNYSKEKHGRLKSQEDSYEQKFSSV
jgi:hypothetical protein